MKIRKNTSKILAVGVLFELLLSNIIPVSGVFAAKPENTGLFGDLEIGGAVVSMQDVTNGTTVAFDYGDNNSLTVTGTGLYSYSENNRYHIAANGEVTVTATAGEGFTADLRYQGNLIGAASKTFQNLEHEHPERIDAEFAGESEADIVAELRIKCADNSDSCLDAGFSINDGFINGARREDAVLDGDNVLYYKLDYHYNGDGSADKINLRFETLWNRKFSGDIFVNGHAFTVSDYVNYADQKSWLDHYNRQTVGFVLEVPKTNNNIYEITIGVEDCEYKYIGNFLWSADPVDMYRRAKDEDGNFIKDEDGNWVYEKDEDGNLIPGDDFIGNSKLEVVAVSFTIGNITYSCDRNIGQCNQVNNETGEGLGCDMTDEDCGIPYVEYDTDPTSEYEQGSLVLPAGARITMRVIPDYGYQVLNVNMSELITTDEGFGEFTFTVPAGAAYFVADVVETEDEVDASSEAIESGSINLGDDQTTLDHGTARLEVGDADLTDEEKKEFENTVSEGGYETKTFLDISLFNITYRGNTDSAWEEQIDDLNETATITFKLADDVDGNDIVIVHQKHDGTYEIIPTVYDPVAHTITFKTSSFSNYAIASRTVESPDTGAFVADGTSAKATTGLAAVFVFTALAFVVVSKRSLR